MLREIWIPSHQIRASHESIPDQIEGSEPNTDQVEFEAKPLSSSPRSPKICSVKSDLNEQLLVASSETVDVVIKAS